MLGEGERCFASLAVGGEKNGDVLDSELSAGDAIGGLCALSGVLSPLIQGPERRFSPIADSTGDVAPGDAAFLASCLPSA